MYSRQGALCLFLAGGAGAQASPLFDRLQWRMIGPFRGGRAVAVAGAPGDPATFYFGSVGGGVWKTMDAGMVWTPLFDQQPASSIGAIAVAPSMPNVVYAGTGEADIRSQIGFGDGIYKSTDAGQTWTNVGLRDTRQISKIVIDPRDPNTVFVAATSSIGAIAVAPSMPNDDSAGTGEADIRSQLGFGDGIYKSPDAAQTAHNACAVFG